MDSRCSPERIRKCHGSDQGANLSRDLRPSWVFRLGQLAPIPLEALPMPGDHCLRSHDHQCRLPILPDHPEADPKQSISDIQSRPLHIAFE